MLKVAVTEKDASDLPKKPVKDVKNIKCSACGKKLGQVIVMEHKDVKIAHTFQCPCGKDSFTINTENKTHLLLDESVCLETIKTTVDKQNETLRQRYFLK